MALYVKKITRKELANAWGFDFTAGSGDLYIRSKKSGEVNFDTASVYTTIELIEKNNVTILN